MACGTGKTYTSLKIAEAMKCQYVLFLVPSISLLSQTLTEWTAEADKLPLSFAVCSDTKVGKNQDEDISICDLAYPATTKAEKLATQLKASDQLKQALGTTGLTVVFSTYQSIQVISDAQEMGAPDFDLIICDEAHRTTGIDIENKKTSPFIRVHDKKFIKGNKRLYMTATPRIYDDASRTKANENDADLFSMDDQDIYGTELHSLGFSDAINQGLLTDYKVMVLAVEEKYVSKICQDLLTDQNNELKLEDAVKITGCWNGLSKRKQANSNSKPMQRAVAFCRSIKDSEKVSEKFSEIVQKYKSVSDDEDVLDCEVEHVDGTFNALKRNSKLQWLKQGAEEENTCRILSNARCLSEGIDVPALDAVMFLNPRNSVVDVVQSVGRVMRKAEGKDYGYIILPIGVPSDKKPEEALQDNQKYKVVWQVLQALRAHDDRFNAMVNKIDLNIKKPDKIDVIGVGGEDDDESYEQDGLGEDRQQQLSLNLFNVEEWREAIYGKIVQKCGSRLYWENWASDVAKIAQTHITRISALLEESGSKERKAFDSFLEEIRDDLNESISETDAIEMLAQHIITKPVFEALFEDYSFSQNNPVSIALDKI